MSYPIYWIPSPKFTPGHPKALIALVHHRMVGTLKSTDSAFSNPDGREASTNFGVGYGCGREGHPPLAAHIHQYVRLGDQAWGNGNWDPSGAWDDRYPTTYVNSRTISIEHHDNGGAEAGSGRKGVVPEKVLLASIWLDQLLLSGSAPTMRAAGIQFRDGTADDIARELRAMPVDRHHIIEHHYIAGRLKPFCWRPWADDPTGFPQARYLAALTAPPPEDTVNSYPVPKAPSIGTVADLTWLYDNSGFQPSAGNTRVEGGARDLPYLGQPTAAVRVVEYVDSAGVHSGKAMFVRAAELTNIRLAPDPTPYDEAAIAGARADGLVQGGAAEQARIRGVLGL